MKKRFLSLLLCLALLSVAVPYATATSESELRDQFVSYAASLKGSNGPSLGFEENNWCVYFINYCAKNNGTDINSIFPDTGSVTASAKWFANQSRYYYFDDSYIPQNSDARKQGSPISMDTSMIEKGDLAYFISNSDSGFEHIGIVESVDSNGVVIIHGSWSNRVARTTVTFGKTIGQNHPVRFAGIAKPNYISMADSGPQGPDTSTTKAQYRYHRYVTSDGRASLCPYYGESTYGAKLTLQYTEWLDKPLTKNSSPSGHNHVNQGAACTNAGCVDPSRSTERYTDGSSNWYYEETRTVTVEIPATPSPEPPVTSEPEVNPSPEPDDPEPVESLADVFVSLLPEKFSAAREWSVLQFDDISTKAWYYENVKSAYCYDLMNGRGASEFAPNGTLTVAESITLAVRIHARYYGKTIPSFDGGKWYDGYVSYARQNGIYAEGPYDVPATREVFARILAAALPVEELWDNGSSIDFMDEFQIQYLSSVELLCRAGVINGTSRGGMVFFDPDDTITRAQAAAIVTRMVVADLRTQP